MGTEVNILVTLSSGIWALNERGMKEHSGAIKIYTFFWVVATQPYMYLSKFHQMCTYDKYNLLYVNYTSRKEKKMKKEVSEWERESQ